VLYHGADLCGIAESFRVMQEIFIMWPH